MADLGEEAFSSQMKVVATFLRLLEELMRNKQQDLRYGTKTQRRGILGRMKDFVGGIFKKVYDGTFGRLSRNGKDYGQLDLNDPAVAKLFADTMKQMGMDAMHEDNNLLFSTSDVAKSMPCRKIPLATWHLKLSVQTPTSISPSAARASFPTKPASLPKRRPVSSRLRTSAAMRPFADRMKSPGKGEPI